MAVQLIGRVSPHSRHLPGAKWHCFRIS